MFSNTERGAKASAVLYSVIETALCRIRYKRPKPMGCWSITICKPA